SSINRRALSSSSAPSSTGSLAARTRRGRFFVPVMLHIRRSRLPLKVLSSRISTSCAWRETLAAPPCRGSPESAAAADLSPSRAGRGLILFGNPVRPDGVRRDQEQVRLADFQRALDVGDELIARPDFVAVHPDPQAARLQSLLQLHGHRDVRARVRQERVEPIPPGHVTPPVKKGRVTAPPAHDNRSPLARKSSNAAFPTR